MYFSEQFIENMKIITFINLYIINLDVDCETLMFLVLYRVLFMYNEYSLKPEAVKAVREDYFSKEMLILEDKVTNVSSNVICVVE